MRVEEMRLGNYYKWYADGKEYYFKVDNSFFSDINLINNAQPIELTEEILLTNECFKLSYFKDSIRKKSYKIYSKEFIKITEEDGLFVLVKPYDNVSLTSLAKPFKYLHQLQNLYFALTNEELNVKI